jgi:hypothetical protein
MARLIVIGSMHKLFYKTIPVQHVERHSTINFVLQTFISFVTKGSGNSPYQSVHSIIRTESKLRYTNLPQTSQPISRASYTGKHLAIHASLITNVVPQSDPGNVMQGPKFTHQQITGQMVMAFTTLPSAGPICPMMVSTLVVNPKICNLLPYTLEI